jgi:hypothetical protein
MSKTRTYASSGRQLIQDGDIISSRITRSIVSDLPFPSEDGDAISLSFLNQYTSPYIPFIRLNLKGTMWVDVPEAYMPKYGNRCITIECTMSGGPNGHWRVARESQDTDGEIDRYTFTPKTGPCYLSLQWLANTLLQVRKSTDAFDGIYELSTTR